MLNTVDQEIAKIFTCTDDENFSSYTEDSSGNRIGFLKFFNGDTYLIRKNKNQSPRAIKYLSDGTHIIFVQSGEDGLPAKHVFSADNSEIMFKYTENFYVQEIISFNADASIFKASYNENGSLLEIYDEINKNGKTFSIKNDKDTAFINIDRKGKVTAKGSKTLLHYLRSKFYKELALID